MTLVEWWTAFNDPTLSSLVDMAVRANLDVRLAEARIRQARAALGVAGGAFWPTVDATALYERSHSPAGSRWRFGRRVLRGGSSGASGDGASGVGHGSSGGIPPFRELFQAGLDASWELDVSGARDGTLRPPGPISRPRWRTAATFW